MIGLRLDPVFEVPANMVRFSEALRSLARRRLVSLVFEEDLESARVELTRRGFFIRGAYPFELPFFSDYMRLRLVALDLRAPHPRPAPPGGTARVLEGRRQDNSLTGGLDTLPENNVVHGPLRVSGWARIPGEDLAVRILIDGEEIPDVPIRRFPRPDVTAAIPKMGDCTNAGFEARFELAEGDEGRHEITAVFFSRDGRYRIYPPASFTWTP